VHLELANFFGILTHVPNIVNGNFARVKVMLEHV